MPSIVSLLIDVSLILLIFSNQVSSSTCSAFPNGFYSPLTGRQDGLPSNSQFTYQLQPDFLTCDEVKQLNTYCVDRINRYRSGELTFSNGQPDPALGTPSRMNEPIGDAARCQAEITLGDFALMTTSSCNGAHANAFSCPAPSGSRGQNSCCPRQLTDKTLNGVIAELNVCLQSMWDEGIGMGSTDGHWKNMKNPNFNFAVCAFVFAQGKQDGETYALMQQNFGSRFTGPVNGATASPSLDSFVCNCPVEWLGDGECDVDCDTSACSFDGEDCVISTQVPTLFPTRKTRAPSTFPTKKPTTSYPATVAPTNNLRQR